MEENFIHFPMFVNLKNKNVVVIGGGQTAYKKILTILKTGAKIKVIAPWFCDELKNISNENLSMIKKMYDKEDIKNAFMVLAITDDKEKCDFLFPGIIIKDNCCIGVCGNGKNNKSVKNILNKIRNIFK